MRKSLFALLGIVALLVVGVGVYNYAHADVRVSVQRQAPSYWEYYQFFATTTSQTNFATTTSATSTQINTWTNSNGQIDKGYFVVAGSKRVDVFFSRGDTTGQGNTGNTVYKIQVTGKANPAEEDWVDFQKLVQATSTTEQATGKISAATSTLMYGLDLAYDAVYAVRCIVVETTDGEHSCAATAQY